MTSGFKRFGGFATSSAVSGIGQVGVVPILLHAVGAGQWGGIAVGQSIGAIAAIFLGLGWGVSGAAAVASAPQTSLRYLHDSLTARAVIAIPIVVVAVLLTALIAPAVKIEAAATTAAFAAVGLGSNWFYIGVGRPRSLLLRETVPRTIGSVGGALLVLAGLPLITYPAATLAGCLLAVALTALLARPGRGSVSLLQTVRTTLREQSHAAVTGIVSATYINLPTVAVAVFAPSQTPVIALADRLFTFANAGLAPFNQTLQGWIPHPDPGVREERIRRGTRFATIAAGIAAVCFALLARPFGSYFSGGQISLGWPIVLAFAATLGFTTMSQTVGVSCLTSLGAIRSVAMSAVVGAVVGLAVLVPASALAGAPGAATAETIAEGLVIAIQLVALRRLLRLVTITGSLA